MQPLSNEHAATTEAFRFTQGWASIGTVLVGLLAVAVASYWNHRTLKRADERYRSDAEAAHDDKVRDVIVEVVHATTLWAFAAKEYCDLIIREFEALKTAPDPETGQVLMSQLEEHVRKEVRLLSSTQNDLRRALWTAQLVVDDEFVLSALAETVELLGIRKPVDRSVQWPDMPQVSEDLRNTMVKVTAKVDDILDYALANLKKMPPSC
ncbi:hypothetical protein [Rhodococcus sp. IEGM 1343]|uniref:hypothetical protein n=1 Tax=Rhodococcus sp. IEGM 1343 TaxID=3082224 RepID=UPI0029542979|nr:hypothetical protein [Rhodococcus sp. IEGM 1343]MDV8056476.1 hypothetical protein [Rhodococcus sp. IEGM 1343]